MHPQALGYVGIRAKNTEDWSGYGRDLLGLQLVDQSRSTLAFRMDDRKQRIVIDADGGEGIKIFGWEVTSEPFRPGRNISGFRTGALGLGHVVLHVERFEDVMAFYRDTLGFRVSDYFTRPYPVYFFHV